MSRAKAASQARTLGFVGLIGTLFRNLPELWAERWQDIWRRRGITGGMWVRCQGSEVTFLGSQHICGEAPLASLSPSATGRHVRQERWKPRSRESTGRENMPACWVIVSAWLPPRLQRTRYVKAKTVKTSSSVTSVTSEPDRPTEWRANWWPRPPVCPRWVKLTLQTSTDLIYLTFDVVVMRLSALPSHWNCIIMNVSCNVTPDPSWCLSTRQRNIYTDV